MAERLSRASTPFIVVTGHTQADLPAQFSGGMVVAKPVDPKVLLRLVMT